MIEQESQWSTMNKFHDEILKSEHNRQNEHYATDEKNKAAL